jgi:hypothetical protein
MICLLALLVSTSTAFAEPPTRESVATLLTATNVRQSLDGMLTNMDRITQQQFAQALAAKSMTAEQQRAMASTQKKISDLLHGELTWAKLEPIYIDVYQQTYTQEEVDGLIAFYRTPVGRSYVEKMPLALQRTLVAMQPLLADMMQKSQALARQALEEAKEAKP